jgi:Flp pilus assembly pilin Flp
VRQFREQEQGQAFGEYAVLVGAIAIGCVLAVLFLSGAITGLFESTANPTRPGVFRPPTTPQVFDWPTTFEECEDEGWRDFPQFIDELDCKKYVKSLKQRP